jgi:hypothetical protein
VIPSAIAQAPPIAPAQAIAPGLDLRRFHPREIARARLRKRLQVLPQVAQMPPVELMRSRQFSRLIDGAFREQKPQHHIDGPVHRPPQRGDPGAHGV